MLITDKQTLRDFYADHRVWQGIPGIARTNKGRTFVCFYSGGIKEQYGNFTLLTKSDDGIHFSEPIAATFKEGAYRCFDPVLWLDPLGRLWYIWNVMPGDEVYACVCSDPDADELNWSEEFYIGRGVMMNKPVVLTTGEWLFPIALWQPHVVKGMRHSGLREDDIAGSYVYKTTDNGKTFTRLGCAQVHDRVFDEHMVLEQRSGILKMLVRTKYGIGEAYSYDRGHNWSSGEDSTLGGPNSRFHITRLRSGRILLINHINTQKRDNLAALLSEDDGKTFPYSLMLDTRDDVSYPDACQDRDGNIHITYDRERDGKTLEEAYQSAREILIARITEEDILAGRLVSPGSFLQGIASKLGKLAPDAPDPYQTDAHP